MPLETVSHGILVFLGWGLSLFFFFASIFWSLFLFPLLFFSLNFIFVLILFYFFKFCICSFIFVILYTIFFSFVVPFSQPFKLLFCSCFKSYKAFIPFSWSTWRVNPSTYRLFIRFQYESDTFPSWTELI